jgi:hydroxymethylglutaryl-CoA lyase
MTNKTTIHISEVGPRDGLQSVKATMPTADKCRWISALAAAGLREIEVGSFVPAQLLPQMADVADVVRHALTLPGLTVMALVPNRRGAQAALAAQATAQTTAPMPDEGDASDAPATAVAVSAAAALPWPATLPEQVRAVAQVLQASPAPLPLPAIEAAFKGKGPWKKGLPRILETLEALGRARQEGGGWRG